MQAELDRAGATVASAGWTWRRRPWRDALELFVGYGLIVLVIWSSRPWQHRFYWVAVAWILMATGLSFEGWRTMGFRLDGIRCSLWLVWSALGASAIAIAMSIVAGTYHPPLGVGRFLLSFWGYFVWAFFQQFLLQDFVLLRLLRLLPSKAVAVALTAVLFALAHLPNPILAPLTLAWGVASCLLFLRYRNLYTIAVVHAILGWSLAITVPATTIHSMRVGRGYLTYPSRASRELSTLPQGD